MITIKIPENNNDINLLKPFFTLLSKKGFYNFENIEFLKKDDKYILFGTYDNILGIFENIDENNNDIIPIILDEYNNINIIELIEKMNNSKLIIFKLCDGLTIMDIESENVRIEKIEIKFY